MTIRRTMQNQLSEVSHTKIYAKFSIYYFLKKICYWNFLSHKCTTLEFVVIYMCKFLCLMLMMCSCKINVICDHQHWWVDYNILILIWIQNYLSISYKYIFLYVILHYNIFELCSNNIGLQNIARKNAMMQQNIHYIFSCHARSSKWLAIFRKKNTKLNWGVQV